MDMKEASTTSDGTSMISRGNCSSAPWGPLGNDKDCVSELSRVRNEKPGAFTHNHPFVVGR